MTCPTCGRPDRTITDHTALAAEKPGTVVLTANGATARKSWSEPDGWVLNGSGIVQHSRDVSVPAVVLAEAPTPLPAAAEESA